MRPIHFCKTEESEKLLQKLKAERAAERASLLEGETEEDQEIKKEETEVIVKKRKTRTRRKHLFGTEASKKILNELREASAVEVVPTLDDEVEEKSEAEKEREKELEKERELLSKKKKESVVSRFTSEAVCRALLGNDTELARELLFCALGGILLPEPLLTYLAMRFFEYAYGDSPDNRFIWLGLLVNSDLIWRKVIDSPIKIFSIFRMLSVKDDIKRVLKKIKKDNNVKEMIIGNPQCSRIFFNKLDEIGFGNYKLVEGMRLEYVARHYSSTGTIENLDDLSAVVLNTNNKTQRERFSLLKIELLNDKILNLLNSNEQLKKLLDITYSINFDSVVRFKFITKILKNVWKKWEEKRKLTKESIVELCQLLSNHPYQKDIFLCVFSIFDFDFMIYALPILMPKIEQFPLQLRAEFVDSIRHQIAFKKNMSEESCGLVAAQLTCLAVFSQTVKCDTGVIKTRDHLLEFSQFVRNVYWARLNEKTNAIYTQLLSMNFNEASDVDVLMNQCKQTALLAQPQIVISVFQSACAFSLRHCFCFLYLYRRAVVEAFKEKLNDYMQEHGLRASIKTSISSFLGWQPYELSPPSGFRGLRLNPS